MSDLERVALAYQTPDSGGNAATLVRLAAILNLVMGGLDIVYGLLGTGTVIRICFRISAAMGGGPALPPGGGAGSTVTIVTLFLLAIHVGEVIFSFTAGTVKTIGGIKMLRIGRQTRGWGIAAGIMGCTQLCLFCMLPLAVGTYTIVILCKMNVRGYLERVNDQNAPRGAFEVTPL